MILRLATMCLAIGALSGCVASFSESDAFRPQPVDHKATSAAEMQLGSEFKLTGVGGAVQEMPWLKDRLPATVKHDLVSLGGETIGVSRIKAAGAKADEPLIVVCFGNAGDRGRSGVYYAQKTLAYGEVLEFDYPGYGDSTGTADTATLQKLLPDMTAYIDAQAQGRPLVLWGHSLGGFICSELARRSREVDAVVLETTARTAKEVADKLKPWYLPFLTLKPVDSLAAYDTAGALATFKGPILELGAGEDHTLPVPLARSLAKALKAERVDLTYREYPKANHADAPFQDAFWKTGGDAQTFFARVRDWNR